MTNCTPTERTKSRRKPDRGSYDRELIYRILDEAFVCHLGFVVDGQPFVVPTNYVRVGDKLFLRSEEHTSELQSQSNLVCRLLLEKKKTDDAERTVALLHCGKIPAPRELVPG